MLTGQANQVIAQKAMEVGVVNSLLKSQTVGCLLKRSIRYALERTRLKKAERDVMQMREDFIANASHQLRTPITSLNDFLELLITSHMRGLFPILFVAYCFDITNRLIATSQLAHRLTGKVALQVD